MPRSRATTAVLVVTFVLAGRDLAAQTNWVRRTTAISPGTGGPHAMAYDSTRGVTVLLSGFGSGVTAETWTWNGDTWTRQLPARSPSLRFAHAMAYDSHRDRVVLFGGATNTIGAPQGSADTWEWDGTDWSDRAQGVLPRARYGHAMVYDVTRRRCVMFGGASISATLDDTWEWDGTRWTEVAVAAHPPGRIAHAMAYDTSRSRSVMFGGLTLGTNLVWGDTWEWDGATWWFRGNASSYLPRRHHGMAYDAARARTVMFGGSAGSVDLADTWEWDGSYWMFITPRLTAPGATSMAAYDSVRARVVQFNGRGLTAEYFVTAATYSLFGQGCAGSAGIPSLQPAAGALPWMSEPFTLRFTNIPAGRPVFVFFGASRTTFGGGTFPLPLDLTPAGMPGCTLYSSAEVVQVALLSLGNTATWTATMSLVPEYVGLPVYHQGLVYDPPANAMGLTATNAGEGILGLRQ